MILSTLNMTSYSTQQSNKMDVCDSTGNIFVKSNVSMDSAIGYHRTKM